MEGYEDTCRFMRVLEIIMGKHWSLFQKGCMNGEMPIWSILAILDKKKFMDEPTILLNSWFIFLSEFFLFDL
jgi:hypothetical protein